MTATDERFADPPPEFLRRLHAATPLVVVTPMLIALSSGVFLVMTALGISILGGRADEYLRFGANFAPLTTGGEWWRAITCTFVHFGILHLAFNMWALWDSGQLAERLFGNVWFAALYLFAGIAGSLASMLWNQQVISAGASGAVFGVFGALLAYMTVQRGSIPPATLNRLRVSTSVFVTYSLFYGFLQTGIDNAAHLGGLAGGFVMGLIAARPLAPQLRRNVDTRRALLAALLAAVTLPTAAWLVPDTSRVYRQAIALAKETAVFNAELARLLSAFQDIVRRSQAGQMNNADVIRALRADMLPEWDAAVARLARVELDARAPARKDYELLLRYAVARRDLVKAAADYLETDDRAFEQKMTVLRAQADAALRQYRERQKK
jgi:membrane associated rhomboid family serine protease